MIRGGEGHNAKIRQEQKAKADQDREWLLAMTNELLAREEARWQKLERVPEANPNFRPDETDTFRDRRDERGWESAEREYHRHLRYE